MSPKNPHKIRVSLVSVVLIMTAWCSAGASAEERVSVTTKSGRTFRGVVDAKTDDAKLWIRSGTAVAQITRPIAWTRIESVNYDGRDFDASSFQKIAKDLMTAAPKLPRITTSVDVASGEHSQAELARAPRSLYITAFAANWDNDVEVDGLIVTIFPRDDYGELVASRGSLEVELITEMSRIRETITQGESRVRNARIGRWVRAVRVEDYGPLGASYKLPFEAVHPEFSRRVIDFSLVNARFSIPGEGMLSASTTAVRIRPLSPTRDRLENRGGGRFFPIERTGRGKRSTW